MTLVQVPDDDELSINGAWLGPGRRIRARYTSRPVPIAWVTDRASEQPGLDWSLLTEVAEATGLRPILLSGLGGGTERPWEQGEFEAPQDIAEVDAFDAAEVLSEGWDGQMPEEEEWEDEEVREEVRTMVAPFGREFPGLAPAAAGGEDSRQLGLALGQLTRSARIGLVPAARPADVLPRLGWTGTTNRGWPPAQVAAVLRSWEDRFGARLLEVGFADIRLIVSRPPRTLQEALPIAAEHYAFADECARMGLRHIGEIADALVGNPFWDFWWD